MNHNVKFLDEALTCLDKAAVTENPLFEIDTDFSCDDFTKIHSIGGDSISLTMDFSNDGIDIHLNGASEVFSWGKDYIENKSSEVVKMFMVLLASNVQVDSYGDSYKKIVFKDVSTNKILKEMKVFDGFLVNPFKKDKKLFSAIVCNK